MPTPASSPPPIDGSAGTPSSRTLGTGANQAASGNDGRLTIPSGASATPGSGRIPIANGSGQLHPGYMAPGLNNNVRFASPNGNDLYDGKTWATAKLTAPAAISSVLTAGGGTAYLADFTAGPIWIRGDGLAVPGWINQGAPLRIVGVGGTSSTQFGQPSCAIVTGGRIGNTKYGRTEPFLWVVKGPPAPLVIENIMPYVWCNTPLRLGWDYKRNSDLTIHEAAITSWVKGGGDTAVLTLALPAGVAMTNVQRSGGVVTFTASYDFLDGDVRHLTMYPGVHFQVNSTDSDFPSGDYVIKSIGVDAGHSVFTYDNAGADTAVKANIGTWQTHGVGQYCRLDIFSDNVNIPTTMVRVLDATATTVTVTDFYTPPGTYSDIGTYALQDRTYSGTGSLDLINVQASSQGYAEDIPIAGPTVDMAATSGWPVRMFGCSFGGNMLASFTLPKDHDRSSWLLIDSDLEGFYGLHARDCRSTATGIRAYGGKRYGWGIRLELVEADTPVVAGGGRVPALEVFEGNPVGEIRLHRVVMFDAASANWVVIHGDMSPENLTIQESGIPLIDNPTQRTGGFISDCIGWGVATKHPAVSGFHGFYANRIAGDIQHIRRSSPIASARFSNIINPDTSTWALNSWSVGPTLGPDGQDGGIRISGGSTAFRPYLAQLGYDPHTSATWNHTVGDVWVVGGWVRSPAGLSGSLFGVTQIANSFSCDTLTVFKGEGDWQFIYANKKLTAVSDANADVIAYITTPAGGLDIYAPFCFRIPQAAGLTESEIAAYVESVRPQPYYLAPGQTGTMENQTLIAHGGLGIGSANAKAAGSSIGQLTVGSIVAYEPRYAEDGETVLGWAPLYAANVNDVPTLVPGCVLWLRADKGVKLTDQGKVHSWRNQIVGGGPSAWVQGDPTSLGPGYIADDPTYNHQAVLDFTNNSYLSQAWALNSATTWFIVGECRASGGSDFPSFVEDVNQWLFIYYNAGWFLMTNDQRAHLVGHADADHSKQLIRATFAGDASSSLYNSNLGVVSGNAGAINAVTNIKFGGISDHRLGGKIAEIIAYDRSTLSGDEVNSIQSYLASRYALTLA